MTEKIYINYEATKKAVTELWWLCNKEPEYKLLKYVYGVPRGGIIPAIIFAQVSKLQYIDILDKNIHTPENTIIIDDIIDSGKTRKKYNDYKFYAIIDKNNNDFNKTDWVEFWYEKTEADDKDLILRLAQRLGVDVKC